MAALCEVLFRPLLVDVFAVKALLRALRTVAPLLKPSQPPTSSISSLPPYGYSYYRKSNSSSSSSSLSSSGALPLVASKAAAAAEAALLFRKPRSGDNGVGGAAGHSLEDLEVAVLAARWLLALPASLLRDAVPPRPGLQRGRQIPRGPRCGDQARRQRRKRTRK